MSGVFPTFDTLDGPVRIFREPEDLRPDVYEDAVLLPCGHFDGHDCYRHADRDRYVLVYADDPSAVYEGNHQAEEVTDWGTSRAIRKARVALVDQIDSVVDRLWHILKAHPDNTPWDVLVCDTAAEAAELIESLRAGVQL